MRGLIALSVILLLASSIARAQETTANACTLSQVLAARAKIGDSYATFTQERRIHYIRDPLRSSGHLRFTSPDHLEMIVEEPQAESFIYDDGVLAFDAANGEQSGQISIESNLLLSAMFSGLLATLSGNEDELRRTFFVNFMADACNWRMNLVPKSKRVLQKVREIHLRGRDHHIDEVEILQGNGDRSVLSINEQQ